MNLEFNIWITHLFLSFPKSSRQNPTSQLSTHSLGPTLKRLCMVLGMFCGSLFPVKLSNLQGLIARFQWEKINLLLMCHLDIFYSRKVGIGSIFSKFRHWVPCIFHVPCMLQVCMRFWADLQYIQIFSMYFKNYIKHFKIHVQILCVYIRYQNKHMYRCHIYKNICVYMYTYRCMYHRQWGEIFKIQVISKS